MSMQCFCFFQQCISFGRMHHCYSIPVLTLYTPTLSFIILGENRSLWSPNRKFFKSSTVVPPSFLIRSFYFFTLFRPSSLCRVVLDKRLKTIKVLFKLLSEFLTVLNFSVHLLLKRNLAVAVLARNPNKF